MKSLSDYGIYPKKNRGWHKILCPRCSHLRTKKYDPCLRVNEELGQWNCFNGDCGFKGSLENGKEPKGLGRMRKYQPPPRDNVPLRIPESQDTAFTYLKGRGISEEVQRAHRIFISNSKELAFPYLRDGVAYNCKYRGKGKKFRVEAKKDLFLWNEDALKTAKTVCITEGEIDALSFIEAGFLNTVSLPNGGSETGMNLDFLQWVEKEIQGVDEFVIATDGDKVGEGAMRELVRRLGAGRCLQVQYPEGCKDANEVLIKHGKTGVSALVNTARPLPIHGFITAMDVKDDLDRIRSGETRRGYLTGFQNLDPYYTVQRGEWTLVTGIPGHGKSTMLDQLIVNLVKRNQWKIGIFSPENNPHAVHFGKLCAKWVEKPLRGSARGVMTNDEYEGGLKEINEHFFKYSAEECSLDTILHECRQLVYRHGVDAFVIDPWNMVDHEYDYRMPETEYISRSINKIRKFCADFNVHLWLVAHPTKLVPRTRKVDGVEQEYYLPPKPYSIHGSAHWMNKGDNCFTVHKSLDLDRITEIHIDKIRQQSDTGKLGKCYLYFRKDDETFHDSSEMGT
jgi:twinkle protein